MSSIPRLEITCFNGEEDSDFEDLPPLTGDSDLAGDDNLDSGNGLLINN